MPTCNEMCHHDNGFERIQVRSTKGVICKLWDGEACAYRRHLLRLDLQSRRSRCGGAVSDDFICRYVDGISLDTGAVHGFFVRGILRGAADLQPLSHSRQEGEVALSVERPWQGLGVGTALFERTLRAVRDRGFSRLHMEWRADNRGMQRLARKFDVQIVKNLNSVLGVIEVPVEDVSIGLSLPSYAGHL